MPLFRNKKSSSSKAVIQQLMMIGGGGGGGGSKRQKQLSSGTQRTASTTAVEHDAGDGFWGDRDSVMLMEMDDKNEIQFFRQEIPLFEEGPVIRARWSRRQDCSSTDDLLVDTTMHRPMTRAELQQQDYAVTKSFSNTARLGGASDEDEDESRNDDEVVGDEEIEVLPSTRREPVEKRLDRGFFRRSKLFGL